MSTRMAKMRDRNNRIDLLLDADHHAMLVALSKGAGAKTLSATIRALIRREYAREQKNEHKGDQRAD